MLDYLMLLRVNVILMIHIRSIDVFRYTRGPGRLACSKLLSRGNINIIDNELVIAKSGQILHYRVINGNAIVLALLVVIMI